MEQESKGSEYDTHSIDSLSNYLFIDQSATNSPKPTLLPCNQQQPLIKKDKATWDFHSKKPISPFSVFLHTQSEGSIQNSRFQGITLALEDPLVPPQMRSFGWLEDPLVPPKVSSLVYTAPTAFPQRRNLETEDATVPPQGTSLLK